MRWWVRRRRLGCGHHGRKRRRNRHGASLRRAHRRGRAAWGLGSHGRSWTHLHGGGLRPVCSGCAGQERHGGAARRCVTPGAVFYCHYFNTAPASTRPQKARSAPRHPTSSPPHLAALLELRLRQQRLHLRHQLRGVGPPRHTAGPAAGGQVAAEGSATSARRASRCSECAGSF